MTATVLGDVIRGLPHGCVYALVGIGLVLAFRTSGVFNLAFAPQAYLSAATVYVLHTRNGWNLVVAAAVSIVVVSPAFGLVLERFVFRGLRNADASTRLVTTLGLLVGVPALVKLWLGSGTTFDPPVLWPDAHAVYRFGSYAVDAREAAIIVSTAVAVLALLALFRWTRIGLVVSAVVESPRLTSLTGINPNRATALTWALCSILAGLAGVLLSPLFAQVQDGSFFVMLVAAVVVAVFGKLSSIPLTLLGGLLLGGLQGALAGSLPAGSVLANGLRPALPFVILFLLLLVHPGIGGSSASDPLASVDPPVGLGAGGTVAPPSRTRLGIALGAAAALLVVVAIGNHYPEGVWLPWLVLGAVYTVIFLSVTVLTGMSGQVSFCLSTFAAVGAFATAQLATNLGASVLLGIVAGSAIAAALGALLALPTARLSGVHLALATLAFALFFQNVLQPLGWVGGSDGVPIEVPRPLLGPVDLASDRSYLILCIVIAAVVGYAVTAIRRGTLGQYLDAVRGSSAGARSIGIDPRRARVLAFGLSAGIAGLGGGLLATYLGSARPADFDYSVGLLWVASVVTLGSRSIEGAVNAALTISAFSVVVLHDFLPWVINAVVPFAHVGPISDDLVAVLFGVGAVHYARNPDGVLAATRRANARMRERVIGAWARRQRPPSIELQAGGKA